MEPLVSFMTFIQVEKMIDNVINLLQGTILKNPLLLLLLEVTSLVASNGCVEIYLIVRFYSRRFIVLSMIT